jgi:3-phenylpropionate/trans-cinnamate dioxygenase ferredoxin reductase subunit
VTPDSDSAGVVIAGAGQAGFQLAFSLRTEGYRSPITLIGDESWLPYQRPPLSKAFMAGKHDIETTTLRPESFYQDHDIELLLGHNIASIDRTHRRILLPSGHPVPYSSLVLATGARNRLLSIPGAGLDGVCYLRTRDEALDLSVRLATAERIIVVGGGFVGLEFAATAAGLGKKVLVVETQSRLMARAVAPVMSEFFRDLHHAHGVEIALTTTTREILGRDGRVSGAVLSDGDVHPADLVVVGIGVIPNTELALSADLPVVNGIVVDDHLRTPDPHIYAIGDCALHPNPHAGASVRLESVQNAVDQARCVADALAGNPHPYTAVPWFWTEQFDAKLQMVGLSQDCDEVVTRGDPATRKFSVCYFKDNRLTAIDSINRPADHLAGRKILAADATISPQQAADLAIDLKSFAR